MMHLLARGIAIQNGKILLAHYGEKGYWFLPGGHIEPGESGAGALLRECEEEMGIEVLTAAQISTFEHAYEDKGEMQHEITLLYSFDAKGETFESRVPHLDFAWVSQDEFETSIRFLPKALKQSISEYIKGTSFPRFISTLQE